MPMYDKLNPYRYSLTTRLKESELLKQMNASEGEMILDLGCGMGYFTDKMREGGATCLGLDLSFSSLQYANEKWPGENLIGFCDKIPFKDDTFDKVLFTDVIEHMEDDESSLKEIARVLKPSGYVVITTPAKAGLLVGTKLNLLFHDKPGTPEFHYRIGYTAEELSEKLNKCGMEIVTVRYTTTFFGEIFTELLKLLYFSMEKDFETQADSRRIGKTWIFKVYRYLFFPILFSISKIEDALLSRFIKGHLILVKGKKIS